MYYTPEMKECGQEEIGWDALKNHQHSIPSKSGKHKEL